MDATLEVRPSNANTARLDQEAHGVAQPGDISSGVRNDAAHRNDAILGIVARRVVPRLRQAGVGERFHEGLPKHRFGGVGQRRWKIGDGGVLDQRVVTLQPAELFQPARLDAELVTVQHDVGLILGEHAPEGSAFGCAQKQMVAVYIGAVDEAAHEVMSAIRVRARHYQYVDAIEPLRAGPVSGICRELRRQRERRFAAGRLIAVLLPDDQHRRPTVFLQIAAARRRSRKDQQRNRAILLRDSDDLHPHIGRPARETVDESDQLVLAREVRLAGGEGRRSNLHRRIGIACGNRRRFKVFPRRIVECIRKGRECQQD